jgi:hypothetical protein
MDYILIAIAAIILIAIGFFLGIKLIAKSWASSESALKNEIQFLQNSYLAKVAQEISFEIILRDPTAMQDCIDRLHPQIQTNQDGKEHQKALLQVLAIEFPQITDFDLNDSRIPLHLRGIEMIETKDLINRYQKIIEILYSANGISIIKEVRKCWEHNMKYRKDNADFYKISLAMSIFHEYLYSQNILNTTSNINDLLSKGTFKTQDFEIWKGSSEPFNPEDKYCVQYKNSDEVLGWTTSSESIFYYHYWRRNKNDSEEIIFAPEAVYKRFQPTKNIMGLNS